MATTSGIREQMPTVCSNEEQFGTVDRADGDHVTLTRDDQGRRHRILADWVTRVDDEVHVDRPGDQATREWTPREAGRG